MKDEKVWRMVNFAQEHGHDLDVELTDGRELQGSLVRRGERGFALQCGRSLRLVPIARVEWIGLSLSTDTPTLAP